MTPQSITGFFLKMDIIKEIARILIAVIVVEAIYWTTQDYVIFNDRFLNEFPLLYYSSAPLITAILLIGLLFIKGFKNSIVFNILVLLFATYFLVSIDQLYGGYCDDFKNLSLVYFIFNASLLAIAVLLFFKLIVPGLSRRSMIANAISFVVLFLDYYFFLLGFWLFYR